MNADAQSGETPDEATRRLALSTQSLSSVTDRLEEARRHLGDLSGACSSVRNPSTNELADREVGQYAVKLSSLWGELDAAESHLAP